MLQVFAKSVSVIFMETVVNCIDKYNYLLINLTQYLLVNKCIIFIYVARGVRLLEPVTAAPIRECIFIGMNTDPRLMISPDFTFGLRYLSINVYLCSLVETYFATRLTHVCLCLRA